MKKIFKSRIFFFILGVILSVGITSVLAYSLFAPDVGFTPIDNTWNVDNVQVAIDDLRDQATLENFIGNFYLCGDYRVNTSRVSYFDINVKKFNKLTIRVDAVWNIPSQFTFNILADGITVLDINYTGTYTIDVSNNSTVRFYYYEDYGWFYTYGIYTLTK